MLIITIILPKIESFFKLVQNIILILSFSTKYKANLNSHKNKVNKMDFGISKMKKENA